MEAKANPYSNLKIFAHRDRIEALRKGEHAAPVYVRIKPTNVCNHRCYYCSYADADLGLRDEVKSRDYITWEKMQEIINDLADVGVKAITFSGGGEPLVYPWITETMKLVLARNIDLSVITNGQLLKGDIAEVLTKAKWVRISMDSADARTYSDTRGIRIDAFNQVCDNLAAFAASKPVSCELGINFVIQHMNYGQILAMARLARELGVNHVKYTARITRDLDDYHEAFKQEAIKQIHQAREELTRPGFRIIDKYEDDFEFSTVFQRVYHQCHIKQLVTVIAADSKVYFCHDKAYVSNGVAGDLKTTSFKKLWFSPELVERYRDFDACSECQHHCVYDDRNILLNNFLTLDENHINFI